jgi:hypothetical protein
MIIKQAMIRANLEDQTVIIMFIEVLIAQSYCTESTQDKIYTIF